MHLLSKNNAFTFAPKTGILRYKENNMSIGPIDSIGPGLPNLTEAGPNKTTENPAPPAQINNQDITENKPAAISKPDNLNTQDFITLKTQSQQNDFSDLDKVIERMKENIEEVGDIIENFSKMLKKVSKENIGLQLLKATFEAIDQIRGKDAEK